jgi:hypothetical protein
MNFDICATNIYFVERDCKISIPRLVLFILQDIWTVCHEESKKAKGTIKLQIKEHKIGHY